MTEGAVPRMKRNGARLFKNPPQPHMCIQDFLQGSTAPCYVNVLSWDKIAMPRRPSLPVPLYGGMRMPPPRTKTEAIVFAVMANPEVLRISGKNAQDPKKRVSFIELLLDFIEAMNVGIVFTRHYTILKDRDITGELKEVWNAVLAIRDSEQRPPQQETWIDAQPSISQYSQYPEQQQQQHQQEYTSQPPQYHPNITEYRNISGHNMHYENYGHQPQVLPKNDPQIFVSGPMSQQYHGNVPRIALDRYNYRERGRDCDGRDGHVVQNFIAQYQFQPRQAWSQYLNSKYIPPNSNLPYGSAANTSPTISPPNSMKPFQPYISYQQQQQQQQSPPPSPQQQQQQHMDNAMHPDIRRLPQQQQQQQQQQPPPPPLQMLNPCKHNKQNHIQIQYEQPGSFNAQQNNAHRTGRPHMGVAQKNNATKRQTNSPTYASCTNCQTKEDQPFTKPKSPVKVLQREVSTEQQDNLAEDNKVEKMEESRVTLVMGIDEKLKKNIESKSDFPDIVSLKKENVDNPDITCIVDDTPLCQNNSIKLEKPSPETKESETPTAQQQSSGQKNPNKFTRGNARTRKANKSDKHNSVASDSPKRSQPTMNSIIKSVFKINPGASGEDTSGKRKTNGQTKTANGKCENEEQAGSQQGYTILKKETQEEIVSEIAQISIQDCKEVTEIGPVLS